MKIINLLILLLLSTFAFGQEVLVPLTANGKPVKVKAEKDFEAKSTEMLPLPFVDDFSVDRFPGNEGGYTVLWENRTATRNTGWGKNPPTLGVVSLDGADENGYPYQWGNAHGPADTLMSRPINLAAGPDDGIGLSFYYQPRGNNYFLNNPNDSLMLEFYAPELDEWFLVWSTKDISTPDEFTFVYLPITQNRFLKEGFRFRFTNIAPLNGAVGTWNLDYIWLDQNSTNANAYNNDVAFVKQEHSLLKRYTTMPRDHYATDPVGFMRENIEVTIRNMNNGPRTLEGNQIRILYEGNEVAVYPNPNEPGIGAGEVITYTHPVAASPNNIVFDPNLNDEELEFEVQIIHGVSDFSPTASNDTMRFKQNFYTHYAYDDGQAEYGYAVVTEGASVAMRYQNQKSDSIFALYLYTIPVDYDIENTIFSIKIWEDTGNGPGAEIASEEHIIQVDQEEFQQNRIYKFENPVYVPSGNVFVGYTQTNQTEGVKIGLDINTNGNPGNLYYRETSGWSASGYQGSLMIRPMFTSNGYEELISSTKQHRDVIKDFKVFPNPASDFVTINTGYHSEFEVAIFDMSGRLLRQEKLLPEGKLQIQNLSTGIYILKLTDQNGRQGTQKLVVNK